MEVFRLQRAKYPGLDGSGAAKEGARWNSKGVEVIYTAGSRALAMAEVAVHLTYATLPFDYQMLKIDVPDDIPAEVINESDLPDGWNTFPPPSTCQSVGDRFIRERKLCLLKVPSAVVEGDYNILINPFHPEFERIRIIERSAFRFDRRLFDKDHIK